MNITFVLILSSSIFSIIPCLEAGLGGNYFFLKNIHLYSIEPIYNYSYNYYVYYEHIKQIILTKTYLKFKRNAECDISERFYTFNFD